MVLDETIAGPENLTGRSLACKNIFKNTLGV